MSELIARQVLGRLNMTEALVSVHGIPEVAADLRALSLADARQENAKAEESKASLLAAYGFEETGAQKPFAFATGIAVIPVHGSLINRFGASWGYVTGYNFIRSQLNAALADDDVKAVVFDCNSYGGEAAGCFELADEIYAARGRKPLTAVVDSNCYSACYAIASACDRVYVTPTGGAASIGVVAMHISFERALENIGLKVELIYAGAHKVDGNPFSDLPDNVRANIQRGVDKSRDDFVAAVARNRGLDKQVVRDTEAACYRADEALAIGLIDAVSTPTQAVAALLSELSGSTDNQENTMSVQTTKPEAESADQPAVTPVDAAAERKAEQDRCKGILNCEEAKRNPSLANHLAFETDMSVEAARKALSASAPSTDDSSSAANPFQQAMDNDKHPNLGAGGEGGAPQLSKADRILQAHGAASGRTYGDNK